MKKILSIDKDAENYRKGIDELLKQRQDELDSMIVDMDLKFQEESNNIKSEISNEKIKEAEYKAKTIKKEKEEGLNNINIKYQSNKLRIINEVFNGIIKPQ
ncbi:MAG: putative ATPase with chaperone activity [Clostridium sp.]|jgi:predicted ATPase with chaperone activity